MKLKYQIFINTNLIFKCQCAKNYNIYSSRTLGPQGADAGPYALLREDQKRCICRRGPGSFEVG